MTTIGEIYGFIDAIAPFEEQMDFDNSGLLVGSENTQVDKVLVALDITKGVVREAAGLGCQLIISHHPVIFTPLKALSGDSPVYALASSGIAAICAHTNLDDADGGVNSCLGEKLGLIGASKVQGCETGLLGRLDKPYTPPKFACFVRDRLGCGAVQFVEGNSTVEKVAVIAGAGGDYADLMFDAGADAVVTGEAKHHILTAVQDSGKTLIVAGHFNTEAVVLEPFAERLRMRFPKVTFHVSGEREPVSTV